MITVVLPNLTSRKAEVTKTDDIKLRYRRHIRLKVAVALVLAGVAVAAACYSLYTGAMSMSAGEFFRALLGDGDVTHRVVLWHIRMPRVLAALIAGVGLAVAGTVMQCLLRNPLASPFTMGISQGAAFGAAFAIIVLGAGQSAIGGASAATGGAYLVTISAFVGALGGVLVILTLARLSRLGPYSVVLAGVAMGSLFAAATMLLQYLAEDLEVASVVRWTFGDVGRANMADVWVMLAVTAAGLLYFVFKRHDYNAMRLGEETARSLGVRTGSVRLAGVLAAALVTATSVALVGIIGFVGLVAPHITRRLIGGDHRFLVPVSALTGGALLLAADAVARTVMSPTVLPVGILTSFMGAPLFIYLIIRTRG